MRRSVFIWAFSKVTPAHCTSSMSLAASGSKAKEEKTMIFGAGRNLGFRESKFDLPLFERRILRAEADYRPFAGLGKRPRQVQISEAGNRLQFSELENLAVSPTYAELSSVRRASAPDGRSRRIARPKYRRP